VSSDQAPAGRRRCTTGSDGRRPADAQNLVEVFAPYPVASIFSSQYLRCVQTVQPLAKRLRLKIEESVSLAEGHGLAGLHEFLDDGDLDNAVLCTHGDIVWELVEDMVKRKIVRPGVGGFDKGSTWIIHMDGSKIAKARYLPAP